MSDLQQHQSQILDEEQRIHQRCCISHNAPVVCLPGLQHPHPIEEPIRSHKEEDQSQQQTAEDEEAWQSGSGRAEEQRPGGEEEDQELKGQRNVEALTRCATRLQCVSPQQLWEGQEGQRSDESGEAQDGSQRRAEVTAALQWWRLLKVLGDPCEVLIGDAVHRGARDHRCGLSPVVILETKQSSEGSVGDRLKNTATQRKDSNKQLTLSSPLVDSASNSDSAGAWMVTDLSPRRLMSRLFERCRSLLSLQKRQDVQVEGAVTSDDVRWWCDDWEVMQVMR